MPIITIMPMQHKIELPHGSPLSDVEFECFGEGLIPFGCQAGACGACIVEVIDGHSMLGEADKSERAFLVSFGYCPARFRLACQSRLLGDATVRTASGTPPPLDDTV